MVSYQEKVRSKLETKVFARLGKTVTLIKQSSPLYDNRGELSGFSAQTSNITVVPYNITNKSLEYEQFGNIQSGDMFIAVPYTVALGINDVLVLDSVSWQVKEIQENLLPGNVVTIARIARVQA